MIQFVLHITKVEKEQYLKIEIETGEQFLGFRAIAEDVYDIYIYIYTEYKYEYLYYIYKLYKYEYLLYIYIYKYECLYNYYIYIYILNLFTYIIHRYTLLVDSNTRIGLHDLELPSH